MTLCGAIHQTRCTGFYDIQVVASYVCTQQARPAASLHRKRLFFFFLGKSIITALLTSSSDDCRGSSLVGL